MLSKDVEAICEAIREVAGQGHGLEGIAMALGGDGLNSSVAGAISELAASVDNLAEAIREAGAK